MSTWSVMHQKPEDVKSVTLSSDEEAMARGWFGYGRWEARYWFVGIEPGGDELDACVRMWNALGNGELVDIQSHHEEHERDWFSESATKPQPTWQKLIWLLLAYKDEDPSASNVLRYQKTSLGRADGETSLIEISALPAEHNGMPVPRLLYREERITVLRSRLKQHHPRFVVFYSPDNSRGRRYVDAWNAITGATLIRDEPVLVGDTACVMTYHPNGRWDKAYWTEIGCRLRSLVPPADLMLK